ncbi:MAG: NAD(+) diphosphatase [Alphaproteobacteria bacterium]|nr:NAD(+) diphosphatase [Alphaproteobacteria bacterium]
MTRKNFYATINLDRAANQRSDANWLTGQLNAPESRVVPVWRGQNLVSTGAEITMIDIDIAHMDGLTSEHNQPVLLGLVGETTYFSVDISHMENPVEHDVLGSQGEFADLRQVGQIMAPEQGNLLAYARGINYWHQRHRHCGVCGAPTLSEAAGHQRRCTDAACNAVHFPRTDSACIVLVYHEDKIILARADRFPPRMQSVLAGFLEPGESLEDCVAREVFEEVGVKLTDIDYQHSQPWPFPSSLMVGFRARALNTDLHPDPVELASAGWFSRDELKAITPESDLQLPRADSIARHLIEEWLAEG